MNPFRPGIALILVLSLAAAAGAQTADINCTVNQSSQCPSPSVQFLRLSGQTDSHASLSAYDYRVCCSLSSGGRLAGSITANATNSCADLDTEFASLSASTRTNSHIGKDYSAKICMSAKPRQRHLPVPADELLLPEIMRLHPDRLRKHARRVLPPRWLPGKNLLQILRHRMRKPQPDLLRGRVQPGPGVQPDFRRPGI